MSHNPFARPRPNPKRKEPRRVIGRVRLKPSEKAELRLKVAIRAGFACETCGDFAQYNGELSHLRHAANKSDTVAACLWECRECHRKRHNAGGKPVPRKAGRKMNAKEALANWNGLTCFCTKPKLPYTSFCGACSASLSPQVRYDLENATGNDYLATMAEAEKELLSWKPAEEQR